MKKYFNLLLMAALVCGLSLGVTSCKDDEDVANGSKAQEEQLEAKAEASEKFWGVVGQLISYTDITEDYEGKTFEANIGRVADDDPLTRIVATNTLEAAVQNYNDLTGASITTSTATHTYNDPDVGMLTWTKTTDGSSWGTVEVNIKQLPRLQKIVYQSFEQGNNNGKFEGKAYYRFGDIVRVQGSDVNIRWEYWICVRPAFGKEGKEDSHWVCVGRLPNENIRGVNVSNNSSLTNKTTWSGSKNEFLLPTDLGTNKKHMQNFAEMLYAICFPTQWAINVGTYCSQGTPYFTDLDYKMMSYHNMFFWQNVQDAWKSKEVFSTVLNMHSFDEVHECIETDGVRLLYAGYSWAIGKTCKLYEAYYKNGAQKTEKNMHHVEYLTPKKDMSTTTGNIDFYRGCGSTYYDYYKEFFNDDRKYRWVIRHATGEELSKMYGNGRYDPKQPIDGMEDYYRYYRDVLPTNNLLGDPEETQPSKVLTTPKVGCFIGIDGRFYDATVTNVEAAAVVVYLGEKGSVETGTDYRGLAISTQTLTNLNWQNPEDATHQCSLTPIRTDWSNSTTILDGLAATRKLAAGCGNLSHNHPAAKACLDYAVISANDRTTNKLSNWFIPSSGQWALFLKSLGCKVSNNNYFTGKTLAEVNEVFGTKNGKLVVNTPYMTSTVQENDNTNYVTFAASSAQFGFQTFPRLYDGSGKAQVLQPFIAFEFEGRIDDVDDDDDDDIIY